MNAITCIQKRPDKTWSIGYNNELLFHYSEDMELFRHYTSYGCIICGRKTFDSLPKMLPNRIHIVITRDKTKDILRGKEKTEPLIVVSSKKELFDTIKDIKSNTTLTNSDFWVIGGEQIYRMLLPYCKKTVVTSVENQEIKDANVFFPNLDNSKDWKCIAIKIGVTDPITFYEYKNKHMETYK